MIALESKLTSDGLDFNLKLREVTLSNGTPKSLTQLESKLLESLMINAGQVLTVDDLISDIWGGSRREFGDAPATGASSEIQD